MDNQRLFVFLTMTGNAKKAMEYYESSLPNAQIESISYFEDNSDHGDSGKVINGVLSFMGQNILFMDMKEGHTVPEFTWSTSLLVSCIDQDEFDKIFKALSHKGVVMMGPEPIMHLKMAAWVTDQFGVTWQIILE